MTTQDWLYKWFRYALALLPVWWLDAYLLSRWPVWGVTPVLLPVAVAAVSVLEGVSGGAGFGFGAGLLWAGAYAGSDGSRVILLTLLGMLGGALSRYALAQGLLGCILCSAVTVGLVELFHVLVELFFLRAEPGALLGVAAAQLALSVCWSPVVYWIFARVYDRVGGDRLA